MSYLYKDERRILLIDSDVRTRDLRTAVLRNHEFTVHAAAGLIEATPLWKTIPYDLVLLADPRHADSAVLITRIRDHKPDQRIGLLVGPPSFIQEVSRVSAKPKPSPRSRIEPVPSALIDESAATQRQNTIYAIVSDWCAAQAATLKLHEGTNRARSNAV